MTRRVITTGGSLLLVAAVLAGVLFGTWTAHPLVEGRKALAGGQYADAVRLLARAISRGHRAADVYRDLALAHSFLGESAEAARAMRAAMELEPDDLDLVRLHGKILLRAAAREEPAARSAELLAREVLARPGGDGLPHGHGLLGEALHSRYKIEKERLSEEILSSFRGPHVWQVVGAIRHALGAEDYFGTARAELVSYLQRLAGVSPTDPLYDRVDAIRRAQDEALHALTVAGERPGHLGYPVLAQADLLLDLRQPERAEALARALLAAGAEPVADEVRIDAQRTLARAIEADEEASEARLREAASHWGASLYGLEELRSLTAREKELRRFEAHHARGNLFIRMKNPQGLHEVAQSLLGADPGNPHGLFFRGMAAFFEGHYDQAEIHLQQSLNKRHDFVAYMTLGRILALRGGGEEAEQARDYFTKASRLDPKSVEPILAEIHLLLGGPTPNYLDALQKIRQVFAHNLRLGTHTREVAELRDRIEETLLKQDPAEAYASAAEAEAALARNDRARYPLYYLARHHREAGRLARAAEYAARLVRSAPRSLHAALLHAEILLAAGTPADLNEADEVLIRAQELDPADSRPIALAARVAKAMNNGAKHWRLLNRALEVDPHNVDSRLEIVQVLHDVHQPKLARFHLDIALEQMKTVPYAVRRLDLELHLALDRLDRAAAVLAEIESAPDMPPDDRALYRGRLLERQGRTALALEAYAHGSENVPDRGDLVVAAARLERQHKDEEAARRRLETFRDRGGRHLEANALLGDIYLERWRLAEALDVFDEMRRLNYGDLRGQHGFAVATLHLGQRLHEGLGALVFELSMVPRDAVAAARAPRMRLALLYGFLTLKQWKPAIEHLRKLESVDPSCRRCDRALLAYFNGDLPHCRRLVEEELAVAPTAPLLRLVRGLLDLRDGRADRGVIADVGALVADAPPRPPWAAWAERVARARPGFGRLILAAAAEVSLRRAETAAAAAILEVAERAFPGDPHLEHLAAYLAERRGDRAAALQGLERLAAARGSEATRDRAILLALDRDPKAVSLMAEYAWRDPTPGQKLLAWAQFEAGRDHHADLLRTLRGRPHWCWTLPDQTLLVALAYLVDGAAGARRHLPGPETLAGPYLEKLVREAPSGDQAPPFIERLHRMVRALALFDQPAFRSAAAAALDDVLAGDPHQPLVVALRARLAAANDDPVRAAALLDRISADADRALAAHERGLLLACRAADGDEAARVLSSAVALEPKAPEPRLALAEVFLAGGRPHDAIETLTAGLGGGMSASHPRVHALLGEALAAQGDRPGAAAAFARALALDRFDRRVACRVATELLALRRYANAATLVFVRYPGLSLEYPDLRLAIGLALYRMGLLDAAGPFLEGFPYSGEAAICLGHIARRAKRKDEAVRQYRYAFSLDPKRHLDALLEIADIHREDYALRDALAAVNEFLRWNPLHARAQALQAELTEGLLRHDQALREWVQAWLLDRTNPTPLLRCAGLLREKGKREEARTLVRMLQQWPVPMDEARQAELEKEVLLLGLGGEDRGRRP
ncbi:MAG: hypothetical protein JXQ29_18305 [Planctomycetes bacterium]|nr:hypothetical protein [Planctomycetota bacterium]